jgi:uncharacterized membrane protein YjjB (DUF3815 family)
MNIVMWVVACVTALGLGAYAALNDWTHFRLLRAAFIASIIMTIIYGLLTNWQFS